MAGKDDVPAVTALVQQVEEEFTDPCRLVARAYHVVNRNQQRLRELEAAWNDVTALRERIADLTRGRLSLCVGGGVLVAMAIDFAQDGRLDWSLGL